MERRRSMKVVTPNAVNLMHADDGGRLTELREMEVSLALPFA